MLNVGCGNDVRPRMVNVDLRPTGQVVADATRLPFRDSAFTEIRAFDILEHVPHTEALTEWGRVLEDGGTLMVKVPNMHALAERLLARPDVTDAWIRNIYGGHRWGPDGAWDAHHWGWTPETLERDLNAHGFDIEGNDRDLNMTVEAVKA
jgi:predicted SAM-dependent methyltransferase